MTDLEIAIERLTAWIRDHGQAKQKVFIGDLSLVVMAAKESERLSKQLSRIATDVGDLWNIARGQRGPEEVQSEAEIATVLSFIAEDYRKHN